MKIKQIEIMKLVMVIASVLLLVPLFVHAKNGEIHSFSITPSEPIVFKNVTINVGISNPSEAERGYKLKISVIKEGKQVYGKSFYFDLSPGEDISFLLSFIPKEIDEHEVVMNLYDKYETETYDTRIEKFEVLSETGPFDLSLEALPGIVKPGEKVPIIIKIKNMGEKGTDVKVNVEMGCFNQSNSIKEFFVFLEPEETLEKLTDIIACQETGLHRIYSSLILWNKVWASSIDQVFINNTNFKLEVESPGVIEIKQNESKVFDVAVENLANIPINNLKLVLERIPLQWVSIKPDTIAYVKPNETVVFIVNLTVLMDAEVKEYSASISVAGTEILTREDMTLKVLSMATLPTAQIEVIKYRLSMVEKYKNILVILIIGMVGIAVAVKMMKKKTHGARGALLKIKNVIRG